MVDSSPLPDPSELLVHAEWLQRLARTLVRDQQVAEDIVQETWLSALRSGQRDGVRPRPWLARVLQNHLRSRERSQARRMRREAEVAPSELLPSAAELSERADSARVLLDAVLGLAEAQRQVLLLHYFEGLPVARIAALTGTNEVAVRSRIARAVVALREVLERRSGGDRARWLAALAPLANPSRVASTASTGALSAVAYFGSTTMTAKSTLAVATATVLLLGLGLRLFVGDGPGQRPVTDSELVSAIDSDEQVRGETAAGTAMIAPEVDAVTPARSALVTSSDLDDLAANAIRTLSGRVVDGGTRTPVAGARVIVQDSSSDDAFSGEAATWELETNAQGEFQKVLHTTSVVTLEVVSSGYLPQKFSGVVVGAKTEVALRPGSRLVVEVHLDRHGDGVSLEPIENAACRLVLNGNTDSRRTIQLGNTDSRGEVNFALRNRMAHIIVAVPDQPSFVRIYELAPGQDRIQVVIQPAGDVSGRIIDTSTGLAIAGAAVSDFDRPDLRSITDDNGEFRIRHDRDDDRVWVVTHPDYATVLQRISPPSLSAGRVPDIQLKENAVLIGQLLGFEGETQLSVVSKKSYFVNQRFQRHMTLAGPGPVRVAGVPPGESLLLEARDSSGRTGFVEPRAAAPGETVQFGSLAPMATVTLQGHLAGLDPSFPGVVRVRVSRGELTLRDLKFAVRGGDYRATDLPIGKIEAWLEQEGARGSLMKIEPSGGETLLDLDLDLGGRIHGTVRNESGEGVENAAVLVHFERAGVLHMESARSDATGRFVCAGLDRMTTHRVSMLSIDSQGAEILPKEIEGVLPDGAPLEFTFRESVSTITGKVSEAILASVTADALSVEGHCEDDEVSGTVRDDGTFHLMLPHAGPWSLKLLVIELFGEEPFIDELPEGDVIHDARPGVPVEFRLR